MKQFNLLLLLFISGVKSLFILLENGATCFTTIKDSARERLIPKYSLISTVWPTVRYRKMLHVLIFQYFADVGWSMK